MQAVSDQVPFDEDDDEPELSKGYGTFEGVFVPTLLTILGVIMYLREGWVIGNAGLGGGILIILLAFAITAATAMSMASITSNVRIGPGGAYAIISRSLGLEVGGSIGVPLYLSQSLAVALYVFGFRAGWLSIFPDHNALLVDLATFLAVLAIAAISTAFAFRTQLIILVLIIASLVSVAVAAFQGSMTEPITWFGDYPGGSGQTGGTNFWYVWAVFFPAATGIMAGANLSGELESPRRSIPRGTLAAVAVSLVVYLLLAVWLATSATEAELVTNFEVMIDKAAWGPAVIAGLLGATFSSALSSLVGAPRILSALGTGRILPLGQHLSARPGKEPRAAMAVTSLIVVGALMLRDLNAIAPLITMFFLITYAMLNVVVLVEKRLALVSFRPALEIPLVVPLLGTIGCVGAMFIVNPVFSAVAVIAVLAFYLYLTRIQLKALESDVRSGLFVALSEWSAKRVFRLPSREDRAWKPNLVVPVRDVSQLRGDFRLIRSITYPKGSVKVLGFSTDEPDARASRRIERITEAFWEEEIFASWASVSDDDVGRAFVTSMETLQSAFFKPNVVLLHYRPDRLDELRPIIAAGPDRGLGIALFAEHPKAHLGRRTSINLWFDPEEINKGDLKTEAGRMDLAVLLALKLRDNWDGTLRLLTAVPDEASKEEARQYLDAIADKARLGATESYVMTGDMASALGHAPQADMSVFGWFPESDLAVVQTRVEATRSTCLFCVDAGFENALA